MKPIKCWSCKYLCECTVYIPCERFEKYPYNSKKYLSVDIKQLAKAENCSERTIYRRLKKS